jgi:hypothetical protein
VVIVTRRTQINKPRLDSAPLERRRSEKSPIKTVRSPIANGSASAEMSVLTPIGKLI